jgi:peptide/nickel transport system substrate-binding protein
MRKLIPVTSFLILLMLTSGCRDRKMPEPEPRTAMGGVIDTEGLALRPGVRGGTMVRADLQELDTLNIVTTRSRSVHAMLELVFEGLLSVHPITGRIQGGVASGYSIVNNGYSILLKIDPEVLFSDGHPCTADDVLFSLDEIYLNPEVDSKKVDVLTIRDNLVSAHKIDDYTVRLDLPVPYRPLLLILTGLHILPKHILGPLIEKKGIDGFNRLWGALDGEIENVIGTGPYMLQDFVPGQQIRFVRNPHYRSRTGGLYLEDAPYLDEVIELLDLDNETRILKFQIGEIDFYDIKDTDIASGDVEILMQNRDEGKYDLFTAGHTLRGNHFLAFNQNPKALGQEKLALFSNARFRRAVSMLIDRERIVHEIYQGFGYLDASPERNVSPFHVGIAPDPLAVDEARAVLERLLGADTDGDGFLQLPSGAPFTFTLYTNEDNPFRVQMGNMIADSMRDAGLDVRFEAADYDLIVTKLLDTFEWDAVILGVEGSIEPNESSWIWESSGALHLWNPYQDSPATEWERRINVLMALGRSQWDFEQARTYYQEYQRIIARELPVIQIIVPAELYGYRRGYGNVIPRPVTYNAIGLVPYLYKNRPLR